MQEAKSSPYISDIQVTYDMAPPYGDEEYECFHRLVLPEDKDGEPSVFLWYKRGDPCITEIKIGIDEQSFGPMYEKIWIPTNKSDRRAAYIFYSKRDGPSPITDLKVVLNRDRAPDGYRKIMGDLIRDGNFKQSAFLCVQTERSAKAAADRAERMGHRQGAGAKKDETPVEDLKLEVGDMCDCMDSQPRWCQARVIQKEKNKYLIGYEHWSAKVRYVRQ